MSKFFSQLTLIIFCLTFGQSLNAQEEIKIGNQIWMNKNLDVDAFSNGNSIKQAKDASEWVIALGNEEPAWCYYEFNESKGKKYGKIYNWYAIQDKRGLAPKNWKIPDGTDAEILENFLDHSPSSVNKLKSKTEWLENKNGSNDIGFNALPGGYLFNLFGVVNFVGLGEQSSFWCLNKYSDKDKLNAFAFGVSIVPDDFITSSFFPRDNGYYVRCIKAQ
jgi:uncharacterized protein (TIGR02145 family)